MSNIKWEEIIIDSIIIICASISGNWFLLFLLLLTYGYRIKED